MSKFEFFFPKEENLFKSKFSLKKKKDQICFFCTLKSQIRVYKQKKCTRLPVFDGCAS